MAPINQANTSGSMGLAELLMHLQKNDPNFKNNLAELWKRTGMDPSGANQGYNAARYLIPGEYANLASQQGLQSEMLPGYQNAIRRLMQMLQNPELMSEENRRVIMGQLMGQFQQGQNAVLSAGGGNAAVQGLAVHNQNQANRMGNEFDAKLFSPSGRMETMKGIGNLFNAAGPNLDTLSQLHAITTGTPRGKSGLDVLGGLAGSAVGGWASGGFKGFK